MLFYYFLNIPLNLDLLTLLSSPPITPPIPLSSLILTPHSLLLSPLALLNNSSIPFNINGLWSLKINLEKENQVCKETTEK